MKPIRAIQPVQLQNREQDLHLADRAVVAAPADVVARLARARALEPPEGIGCRDCWHRGRMAVLRVLDPARQAPERFAELVEQARTVAPTPRERHWLDRFNAGRDAALEAVEE